MENHDRRTGRPLSASERSFARAGISVEDIVRLINSGYGVPEVLARYPDLDRNDLAAALHFVSRSASQRR